MMKLAILGSTGSIGVSAIEIALDQGYEVVALSCNSNAERLIAQYRLLKPRYLAVEDPVAYQIVKEALKSEPVELLGAGGAKEIASMPIYDVIVNAIVGYAGLLPTFEALKSGKRLAIANKESLVVYGEELMKLAKEHGTELLPVDSEHSAIFQCLQGNEQNEIEKLILTASGGPFRGLCRDEIRGKKASEALKHPNWSMGRKISIDSATMMNKGLELIEAMHLFSVPQEKIEIVVHPESIVHSGVKFKDKSLICQLSAPDMKLPIQYAVNYPRRVANPINDIDLSDLSKLTFFQPDYEAFPCLKLAREVAVKGGFYPCMMNSANEFAVELYLQDRISFYEIHSIVENALSFAYRGDPTKIEDIVDCSNQIRRKLEELHGFTN